MPFPAKQTVGPYGGEESIKVLRVLVPRLAEASSTGRVRLRAVTAEFNKATGFKVSAHILGFVLRGAGFETYRAGGHTYVAPRARV